MCAGTRRAYFYSSLYETNVSQYLKLVVINFLGNAFKLSSNVFYLMFAFSRMILIRFERKNVTQKEKHTNVIRIFIHFLLILISFCILSTLKLFQYKLNGGEECSKEFSLWETRDSNSIVTQLMWALNVNCSIHLNCLIHYSTTLCFGEHFNWHFTFEKFSSSFKWEKTRRLFLNDSTTSSK